MNDKKLPNGGLPPIVFSDDFTGEWDEPRIEISVSAHYLSRGGGKWDDWRGIRQLVKERLLVALATEQSFGDERIKEIAAIVSEACDSAAHDVSGNPMDCGACIAAAKKIAALPTTVQAECRITRKQLAHIIEEDFDCADRVRSGVQENEIRMAIDRARECGVEVIE